MNTQAGAWQAIWVGRISIAFAGTATASSIAGNAVDAEGRTYSLAGTATSACKATKTGSGWAR